jgi:hypothetical protein
MMFSVRPRIVDLVSWFFWNASRFLVRSLRLIQLWFLDSLLNPEFLTLCSSLIRLLTVVAGTSALAASNGSPDSMNPAFLSGGSGKFSKLFLILGNC